MTSPALERLRAHLKRPDHPTPHEATCTRSGYTLTLRETFDDEGDLVRLHLQLTAPSWPHAFVPLRPPEPLPAPARFGPPLDFTVEDRVRGLDHASQLQQRLLGVTRVTTGDADFDRAFSADALHAPDLLARALQHRRAREAVRALLGADFHTLRIATADAVLALEYSTLGFSPSQDPRDPARFDALAAHLIALADHLPPLQHDPALDATPTAPPSAKRPATVALVVGAAGFSIARDQLTGAPVFANLTVGLVGAALGLLLGLAFAAWRARRDRHLPYWRHTALLTALLACGALTPALSALANHLNSAFAAPARTASALIVRASPCPDDATPSARVCPVTVHAPHITPDRLTFTLTPADHAQLRAGSLVLLTYRVGLFRAPFLTAIDHAKQP